MKRILLVILPMIMLSTMMCTQPADQTAQEEKVNEVITKFNQRFDNKDLTGMIEYFRDDCRWYTLNGIILKKDQIIPFFEPLIIEWKTIETDIKIFDTTIMDRTAIVRFGTKLKIDSAPDRNSMKNLHTAVLKFELGEWKIWHHHMSSK